jgi:hypothetical protein
MTSDASPVLPRKKPSAWWFVIGAAVLLIGFFLFQLFGPSPAIVVSKETTYITGPLGPDGLPDYEQYLLERLRDGVTPENNAAVLLMRAMWPGDYPQQEQAVVAQELGLVPPPTSEVIVKLTGNQTQAAVAKWLRESAGVSGSIPIATTPAGDVTTPASETDVGAMFTDLSVFDEQANEIIDQALARPWTSEQIPPLGDWLAQNKAPIDMIFAATERPRCYFPIATLLNAEPDLLLTAALAGVQTSRDAARALSARAMWNLGEGWLDAAWEDALAIHRLARLLAQGTTLIDQLVAIAVDGVALNVDTAILSDPRLTAPLARQVLGQLGQFEPPSNMAHAMSGIERLWGLDAVLTIRTHGVEQLMSSTGGGGGNSIFGIVSLDWNLVLAELNDRYDKLETAFALESRLERIAANLQFDQLVSGSRVNSKNLVAAVFSRRQRSSLAADLFSALLLPALTAASAAEDRITAQLELTRVAAALAVFRAEHGGFPQQLAELTPAILNSLPTDLYSPPPGQPFVYRRNADGQGYVLYSVYVNGQDDGGTHFDGSIVNGEWVAEPNPSNRDDGDIVIRVPGRRLEISKPKSGE